MVARAGFGVSSCGPGSEPGAGALEHTGTVGAYRGGYSAGDADSADEYAREPAQLHHASAQDASNSVFCGLGNYRCRRCEFIEPAESVRARDGDGGFVVQTAGLSAHFADMRILILALIFAAWTVGGAESKKSSSTTSTNDPVEV